MRAAALLALLLLSQATLPALAAAPQRAYAAQSLFGAKALIHLDAAWFTLRPLWVEKPSGKGVRIGLIDTGIDLAHPDLEGSLACGHCWRDFVASRAQPYDDHGHGTHVAGILAAHGHWQLDPFQAYWLTGARGMAPEAKLVVAKAMDAQGEGSDARVAAALAWVLDPDGDPATPDGADVVNLSLGIEAGPEGGPAQASVGSASKDAIGRALRLGVPVVVSSGNDGLPRVSEPGDLPGVVTVAAVDKEGGLAAFSNVGPGLDLVAPGVLVSSYPWALDTADGVQDGYAGMAGTSMAAPVVAGTVALLLEASPALRAAGPDRPGRVLDLLERTARPVHDARAGAGLLDAQAALAAAAQGAGAVLWWLVALLALGVALAVLVAARATLHVREHRTERALRAQYRAAPRAPTGPTMVPARAPARGVSYGSPPRPPGALPAAPARRSPGSPRPPGWSGARSATFDRSHSKPPQ
jgi:subtilisin family serine protease